MIDNTTEEDYCSMQVCKLLEAKGLLLPDITTFRVTKNCGEWFWQKEGAFIDENKHLDVAQFLIDSSATQT